MKHTFKTIVAPEHVRQSFTVLRDELSSTDKQLMQAFWNLAPANRELLEAEVVRLKEEDALARIAKKEQKTKKEAEPKKAKKLPKTSKKTKKSNSKAKKEQTEIISFQEDEDDVPCLVVDGTNA